MENQGLNDAFAGLSTPTVADACIRVGVDVRAAPCGLRSVPTGARIAGRVLPAHHAGSVDVFLEAIDAGSPGDVLVIDDGGETVHACVGDLIAIEAQTAGLAGLLVWGVHRDTRDLRLIGLPVFSYGAVPPGPAAARPRDGDALSAARFGGRWRVGRHDVAFADDDGALFVPAARVGEVLEAARQIRETERRQAEAVRAGRSLRSQLGLAAFLERRAQDPSYTFREHLRARGAAIEE